MRIEIESQLPPDECRRRVLTWFDGRLRFWWSTISRGSYSDRIVGRVDDQRIVATVIHGTSSAISLGRFGRQLLSVRIQSSGSGSTITGAVRYPFFDRALFSVVAGLMCWAFTRDALFVAAPPLFLVALFMYENVISPERLHGDADRLVRGLAEAVEGRPYVRKA
jgi:hypothetical protein